MQVWLTSVNKESHGSWKTMNWVWDFSSQLWPFSWHGLIIIPARISSHMSSKEWDEGTHIRWSLATDKSFTPHCIMDVITYLCCDQNQTLLVKVTRGNVSCMICRSTLQWRHNQLDGISNHRRLDGLLNHLFRRGSKKTSKLRVTGLCKGNSPVVSEFSTQRASNVENVSIWWRHHVMKIRGLLAWNELWLFCNASRDYICRTKITHTRKHALMNISSLN